MFGRHFGEGSILGFQFGLYHVVVPLSFLRSISLASLFSSICFFYHRQILGGHVTSRGQGLPLQRPGRHRRDGLGRRLGFILTAIRLFTLHFLFSTFQLPYLFASKFCINYFCEMFLGGLHIHKEDILVPRAYDPSGLRQESRALGATIMKEQRK